MRRIQSAGVVALAALLGLGPAAGRAQQEIVPPPGAQPVYQPTVAAPVGVQVQAAPIPGAPVPGMQAQPAVYTPAELDQMLAPIALYPDGLLTQVLMASTYPVEIVDAARWLSVPGNAAIRGDALVAVLTPLPWDPSVKSLIPFPQIVSQLNDHLDWTQSLGEAFTAQQADVLQQVQVLRAQAAAAGTLVTTPQLRVVHDGPAVIIEPANPAVVYVPVYNPLVVYGSWGFVDYPPVYFPPPEGFFVGPVGVGIGFSVGFGVVGPLWGWGHPSWGGGTVVVNNTYYSRISYNHASFEGGVWRHGGPIAHVPGAGFHAPGTGGFRGAAAGGGFRGAGAGGGFRGPGPAGGFHGSAPAGGFRGPASAGGSHAPASSGGYRPPPSRGSAGGPAARPSVAPHPAMPSGRGAAPAAGSRPMSAPHAAPPRVNAGAPRASAPARNTPAPRPAAAPARSAPASHGGPPPKKH
jgi:hypothetical protein